MTQSILAGRLKTLKIFGELTDWEIDQLSANALITHSGKGTELIAENSESTEVFLVLSGRVDVAITVPGSRHPEIIATMQPGELFGELVLLGRLRRSASAVAKEDCELVQWEKAHLLKLFKDNHHIGYQVMSHIAKVLAERLYSTNMGLRTALAHHAS